MAKIDALAPDEILRSDSNRVHFRDIVPAFSAARASREGSREILTPDGQLMVVDIYILPTGRKVLAGYRSPQQMAQERNLVAKPSGEGVESAVKRLVALSLEVEDGIDGVDFCIELREEFGEFGLGATVFSLVELKMACESEFGIEFGIEFDQGAWCEVTGPNSTVGNFVEFVVSKVS